MKIVIVKKWIVKSKTDRRKRYKMVWKRGAGKSQWTCSCPGWIFTRHCYHIENKKESLGA